MNVRKINETELKRVQELFNIAFEFAESGNKTNDEMLAEIRSDPDSHKSKKALDKWAAFSDSGEMMSSVATAPFVCNFDSHPVKMSGIGDVSTLAQYRGSGGIRGCFEHILPDLYSQGYEFSFLHPFSTGYYEKFGYSMCGEKVFYSINLRSLKRLPGADGEIFLQEGNTHLDDIKKVYRAYTQNFNICGLREDFGFEAFENAAPAKAVCYSYLYKAKDGTPKGVMSFRKALENGKFYMACSDFWFTDNEGLKGLLNLTAAFGTYYEDIRFTLPSTINITSFISEWATYPSRVEHLSLGMARVIDVKKVLQIAKYRGSGCLSVAITDRQISENSHTFTVEFANGKAIGVVVNDAIAADISLSIGDFSRLILGERDVCELQYMENVCVNCDLEKLSQVIYKKPLFIMEAF